MKTLGVSPKKVQIVGLSHNPGPTFSEHVNTWLELSSHCPCRSCRRFPFPTTPLGLYHSFMSPAGPWPAFELMIPANGNESPQKFFTKLMSLKTPPTTTPGKVERMNWSNSVKFSIFECVLCVGPCARHYRACDE